MKTTMLALWVVLLCVKLSAQPDIDVTRYVIRLGDFHFSQKTLAGETTVHFRAVNGGVNQIVLELLDLTVESVKRGEDDLVFSYQSPRLTINLGQSLSQGQPDSVTISYRGSPRQDPQGFGGFYFTAGGDPAAFSIGVTKNILPVNAGKIWFPCVDNFTDKALFEYFVTVPETLEAACGGLLVSESVENGQKTWHWKLNQPIPTYLASVAVRNYAPLWSEITSSTGRVVPVGYFVAPGQTSSPAFNRVGAAFDIFEQKFGPYVWDRVGYCAVNAAGFALEHACNIAYPDVLIGAVINDKIMAHELAHSWFGNLVTCETSGEMWINEGFARYCESIFVENQTGVEQAKNDLRTTHGRMMREWRFNDGGLWPLADIPEPLTYDYTVYEKGATVVHTLRHYMGDEAFFSALRSLFEEKAFQNVNSVQLRDFLSEKSGEDLTDFFDGWVFSGGYPHYRLDSVGVTSEGEHFRVRAGITVSGWEKTILPQKHKAEVKFVGASGEESVRRFVFEGRNAVLETVLPFEPVATFFDPDEKICDARIVDTRTYQSTSAPANLPRTDVRIEYQPASPVVARVTLHLAPPPPFIRDTVGFRLADRFWSVEGNLPSPPMGAMTFDYDGTLRSDGQANLDAAWINDSEDSIVVLYRPDLRSDWTVITDTAFNPGGMNDKKGKIKVFGIRKGWYTLAIYDSTFDYVPTDTVPTDTTPTDTVPNDTTPNDTTNRALRKFHRGFELFPNPAHETVSLRWREFCPVKACLHDSKGRLIGVYSLETGTMHATLPLPDAAGLYYVRLSDAKGQTLTRPLQVE
jgi:aminopeptidase N